GYAADGSPVETSWNKDTGVVTFASVPADMSYSYDTGLDGCVLGVTVSTANTPDDSNSPTSNRGGGGCDALSCGLLALAALTGLVARRKK
ncbi:MAG: hypothetical protein IJR68_01840, partial [Fretibacterium sp.]|nr:hypothetical protein [Fretibacterium sp.]